MKMDFYEIHSITVSCDQCETTIDILFDNKYARSNGFRLICPCCENNLTNVFSTAWSSAYEYNKACKQVEETQTTS